jgi:hypothetical protein
VGRVISSLAQRLGTRGRKNKGQIKDNFSPSIVEPRTRRCSVTGARQTITRQLLRILQLQISQQQAALALEVLVNPRKMLVRYVSGTGAAVVSEDHQRHLYEYFSLTLVLIGGFGGFGQPAQNNATGGGFGGAI